MIQAGNDTLVDQGLKVGVDVDWLRNIEEWIS